MTQPAAFQTPQGAGARRPDFQRSRPPTAAEPAPARSGWRRPVPGSINTGSSGRRLLPGSTASWRNSNSRRNGRKLLADGRGDRVSRCRSTHSGHVKRPGLHRDGSDVRLTSPPGRTASSRKCGLRYPCSRPASRRPGSPFWAPQSRRRSARRRRPTRPHRPRRWC